MKEVIAVLNRKGGVGKTATAHAIGAGLAHKGFRVLFVDLDSQCNLTFDVGVDTELDANSLEVLLRNVKPADAIVRANVGDIIPATKELSSADLYFINIRIAKERRLREALETLKEQYDYVVIDTPPALNSLTTNALVAADSIIVPAQAEVHSLQGIGSLMEDIREIRRISNPDLKVRGILITRYNGRAVLSKDMKENAEQAAEQIESKVFEFPIRECISVKEAQAMRTDIFSYAPKSNAAQDYSMLVEEILKWQAF